MAETTSPVPHHRELSASRRKTFLDSDASDGLQESSSESLRISCVIINLEASPYQVLDQSACGQKL